MADALGTLRDGLGETELARRRAEGAALSDERAVAAALAATRATAALR
jgi:hypothetical protein